MSGRSSFLQNAVGDTGRAAKYPFGRPASLPGLGFPLPRLLDRVVTPAPVVEELVTQRRTKLWELGKTLHCSIIGTCLTSVELRALVRKFGAAADSDPSDHDIHAIGVGAAGRHDMLAKHIQKALDIRHKAVIARFALACSAEELRAAWEETKRSGDIPGGYWAALTHPLATEALVRQVFGDVHMLSHLVGAANRADIRRLRELEDENASLAQTLERQQARLRDSIVSRDATIRDLRTAMAERIAAAAIPQYEAGESSELAMLHGVIADLRRQLDHESGRRERGERRSENERAARVKAERALAANHAELEALRAELEAAEAWFNPAGGEAGEALEFDLSGLTILYVGGRNRQIPHLRAPIEQAGGVLLHFDGGVDEKRDLLPGLVSRADIGVFPVDCVSHAAALSLKRHCLQAGKPFLPLRSSGIGSLLATLRRQNLGL